MAQKKGVGKDKKKKGKAAQPVTPPEPSAPDPVEIARQLRLQGKFKKLELLKQNGERLQHMTYDMRQENEHCSKYIDTLEREIMNELTSYRIRRKELFDDIKKRYGSDAGQYHQYLVEKRDILRNRASRLISKLNTDYLQQMETKTLWDNSFVKLRYLKSVKEEQHSKIHRLRIDLANSIQNLKTESRCIRSRHAQYRLTDLDGRQHRLATISEHLEKETDAHFIQQLEAKWHSNRHLSSQIKNRVRHIKILKDLRYALQLKVRDVGFEHQYLLKYQKELSTLTLATGRQDTIGRESTNAATVLIPKLSGKGQHRSESWFKLYDWNQRRRT